MIGLVGDEVRVEGSRAFAEVLRHVSDKKVWYTQEELSDSLKDMRQFHHNDQGALQTLSVTSYRTEQVLGRERAVCGRGSQWQILACGCNKEGKVRKNTIRMLRWKMLRRRAGKIKRAATRRSPQVGDVLRVKTVGCRSMERLAKWWERLMWGTFPGWIGAEESLSKKKIYTGMMLTWLEVGRALPWTYKAHSVSGR